MEIKQLSVAMADVKEQDCIDKIKSLRPDINLRSLWTAMAKDPWTLDRIRVLLPFLIFNVGLILLDMVLDTITGAGLIWRGHVLWGLATLMLQFAPFFGALCIILFSRCTKQEDGTTKISALHFKQTICHMPYIQPVINTSLLLRLIILDIDDKRNSATIEDIQNEAAGLGFLEAFLEAGLQFILQISIILRLGYITKSQLLSVPLSLISLAFAAMKAYFSQRTPEYSDPNPAVIKNMLFMYPFFLILTLFYVFTWAVIFAYVKAYVIVMIVATMLINLFLVKALKVDNPRDTYKPPTKAVQRQLKNIQTSACFTSLFTPCVVGHQEIHLLMLTGISTTLSLLCWLIVSLCIMIYSHPPHMSDNPPIFHCLYSNSEVYRDNICLYDSEEEKVSFCDQSLIRICKTQLCLPSVRFCATSENSVDKLMLVIILLGLLLACGLFIATFLQWSSDYYNFFTYSNFISRGHGITHRSLVCSVVENGNIEMLKLILAKSKSEAKNSVDISKADCYGDTPLHLACENGDAKMVAILIDHNAMIDSLDKDGQSPLQIAVINGSSRCVKLLIEAGGNVNLQDNQGQSSLLLATQNGQDSIMNLLINAGASPDLQDNFGRSPLHLTAQGGKVKCAEILIQSHAKVDIRDMYASSPLHWAVFWDKIDLVELLIENGADTDLLDDEGKSPFRLAVTGGKHDIAELLMSAGAGIDGLYRRSEVW